MVRKNYKKFVATAATATLVASAIAPVASADVNTAAFTDVPDSYKDAIDFLVSNNIASGKTETQFDIHGNITRGDFAAILARAAGLIDADAPSTGFTDVPDSRALIVNSLKDAGVINGVSATQFGYAQNIKRGDAAKMITKAFDLDSSDEASKFTDVSASYEEAVNALVQAGVTNGKTSTQFGVHDNIKRGDFAKWIHALKDYVNIGDGETPSSGITSVESINDTTVEVNFAQAVDKDFIREAERNGEYFRVFLQGDSASSDKAIKSETITFSNDGKTARFTLGETVDGDETDNFIESGKKYTVALTNGDNKTADVQYKYGPTELKASAARPDFTVDAVADKIFVKFGEKMKSSALNVDNYEVYDEGGKLLGDLSDFVKESDEGTWVDATRKTEVEFTLNPDANEKLLAGKSYKLFVEKDVKTDKNKTLSERDRTITVKTPSVNEAKPKAVMARVTGDNEIVVVFDKDVDGEITVNTNQVEVKTTTGKTVAINDVVKGDNSNEIKIETSDDLNKDTSYNVDLPANAVTNVIFPNASSDSISKLKAEAQDDVEIKSVKAELKASPKNKKRADLHLTFDERPNLDTIDWSTVVIEDGSDVYEVDGSVEDNVKYIGNKTIAIENVSDVFSMGSTEFRPEKGTTYTLEIGAEGVETDSFGNNEGKKNQAKLKTTFGGVSVNEPRVDKITLVSEKEIKIDFKETISNVSADDVYVAGFELYSNGNFDDITLNGSDHLTTSVSGSTLTLKTKGDTAFRTGFDNTKIEIKANSFTSKDNKVENEKVEIDGTNFDDYKNVDNAGPILIGAKTTSYVNEVELTFSEALEEHGDSDKIATLFSVKNAANNAVGKAIDVNNDKAVVTFNDVVIDNDTVLNRIEVSYNSGGSFYLNDEKGNKAAKATVKGVKGEKPENGGNSGSEPTDPEEPEAGDTVKATEISSNAVTNVAPGVFNFVFEIAEVQAKFDNITEESIVTLEIEGKDSIELGFREGKFYKSNIQSYTETELKNAIVTVK